MDRAVFERMAAQEERHWWFRARRQVVEKALASLDLPSSTTILEAGCGTGGNLSLLSHYGGLNAFEPDLEALAVARSKSPPGVELEQGFLPDDFPFSNRHYDLIVACDVLEHVEDDRSSFTALRGCLNPKGHLVLTVPAHPGLWSHHDELHHHFRRYRLKDMREKLQEAGLEIVHLSHFNSILFPAVYTMRKVATMAGKKGSDDEVMPPAWLNRTLYSIASTERFWATRLTIPFGVSLLAIARLPG